MTRTLALVERGRHLVRLDPLDVAFLRALPRRWLRLDRVGRRGRYLLSVRGIAGTIDAPTVRLSIAPKIPVTSLWLLLDAGDPPSTTATPSGPVVADALVDAFAAGFLSLLGHRILAGLQRGYQEEPLSAPLLQGRLDLPTQLRAGPTRPEVLHQIHDAFTADIPCNRLLRSALDALRAVPCLTAGTRTEAERLARALADVQALRGTDWTAPLAAPPEYAPVLDAGRLVLGGLAPAPGSAGGVIFVVELERLFERYLLRGLESAAALGVVVEPQARRVLDGQDGLSLVVQPDALVCRDGVVVRVIDAKWKRLKRVRAHRADLYQMLAYAETLAVPEVVLVYPGLRTQRRDYPPTGRGTVVSVWTMRLEDRDRVVRRLLGERRG
jgi:5-methylcytosine-specific restriction enzyme subunit McrC